MLYHGSNHYISDQIEPRISFDGVPLVYATDDFYYALVRAGRFNPDNFTIKEDYQGMNKPFRLIELYPGAFEIAFDCEGYIYCLDDKPFVPHIWNEYISIKPVEIQERIPISNVLDEVLKHPDHYELIRYEDSEPYWQTVNGGKEGYLKRREERAAALKEAQQQMKKKFHLNELIADFKKVIQKMFEPILHDQMSRILICSGVYCLIGATAACITNKVDAIPRSGLILIPIIDILISTFIKYYY